MKNYLSRIYTSTIKSGIFWITNYNCNYFCFPDVPSPPTAPITVTNIDSEHATLHWNPPKDDGGADITGYIIERRDAGRTMWTKVGSVAGAITSFTDTRLTEGTEYSFRVSAENEVGISEPLEMDKSFIAKSIYGRYYEQN